MANIRLTRFSPFLLLLALLAACSQTPLAPKPAQQGNLSTQAVTTYQFVRTWGSSGSGNGQFHFPGDIAVDSSGNVYVVDSNNSRIEKFDSSGTYLTQWGSLGSGNGQLNYPIGVAVDGSGNVYVADTYNNRIQKFDSSGTYLNQWGSYGSGNGQFHFPVGVAVDSSGNVYVMDTGNNRIEKFKSDGTYLTHWGSGGTGNGQFDDPYGIAVDSSGNVYVADNYNNRIEKFDSSGTYLTQWGSLGSGNGQFAYPEGVAVDSSGNVYVMDTYNNRIEKFDSSGNYITQWGSGGTGNGQFYLPSGIAVDSQGNVYVADTYNNRIEEFALVTDTTPPTASPTQTPAVNANGWNNTDVTVTWNWAGEAGGSGLDTSNCTPSSTSSGEGSLPLQATCDDLAGNQGSASYIVKVDKTSPTLNPVVTPNPVLLNGSASVVSHASDSLSGLASQNCGTLDTSSVGSKSVSCTATDKAGNTASKSVNYQVVYPFSGFDRPIDNLPTVNKVKAGRAIPVKFSLGGDQGLNILASGSPSSQQITCDSGSPTSDVEQTVTAGHSGLHYSAGNDTYTYVWKTAKGWGGTCRQLSVTLVDGTTHTADFKFK